MAHPLVTHQITFLYTSDLPATARFYEDLFGFELVLDQGTCRIYSTGNGYLGFCLQEDAPSKRKDMIVTLVTPNVDEWYYYLLERGVTFEKQPELNPKFNIYHCFLRDINGYLIEIQNFLNSNWDQ